MLKLKFKHYEQLSEGARWKNVILKQKDDNQILEDDKRIVTTGVNWEIGDYLHETIRPGVLVDEEDNPKWSQGVIFEGPRREHNGVENFKPGAIIVPYRWKLTEKDNHIEIGFLNRPNREIPLNIAQTKHGIEILEFPRGYAEKTDTDWIQVAKREFQQEFADIDTLYPKVLGIINCNSAIIATYIYVVAIQLNDIEDDDYTPRDLKSDPLEDVGKSVWLSMEQIQKHFLDNPFASIKCGLTLSALSLFLLKSFMIQGQPSMSWNANATKTEFSVLLKYFIDGRYDGKVYDLARDMAECDVEVRKISKGRKSYINTRTRYYSRSITSWLTGTKPSKSSSFEILAKTLGIDNLEKLL